MNSTSEYFMLFYQGTTRIYNSARLERRAEVMVYKYDDVQGVNTNVWCQNEFVGLPRGVVLLSFNGN